MALHTDTSYWVLSTETAQHGPLLSDIDVDVAVVGGGITGICTAAALAQAGRSVALLEADRVAQGITGHTTAKVSALHGALYHRLSSRLGDQAARDYATTQQLAMQHVLDTVEALDVDCDLERRPAFVWGENDREAELLRREADAARRAGLDASFTRDTGLPFPVTGAVRVEDQLMFHPLKYLKAVVEDFVSRGGQVYEGTRVTGLEEGAPSTVTCANGVTVRAGDVVVATHFPLFHRSLMFARLTSKREFVVTGVVPPEDDPPGMYINAGSDTRSVRSTPHPDGRLLLVTGAPFTPGAASASDKLAELVRWLRQRFGVGDVTHTWAAQDNRTGDGVPFIGLLHPGASHTWTAAGFHGWGMTNGVLAGLLLRDLITGRPPAWARLYDPRRLSVRWETPTVLDAGLRTVTNWVGERVRSRLTSVASAHELSPGQAGVVRDDDGEWATYVDDAGVAHSVSATCTHLGCRVHFNEAEREWQCPCHSSRFALDGSVLHGPATRPLQRRPGTS